MTATNEVGDTRAAVNTDSQMHTPLEGERHIGLCEIDGPSEKASWGELLPLDDPTVPEFPVEAMPDWAQDHVRDVSKAMGNPPDLAAMSALGVMNAAVLKKAEVRINESHREPLALYLCGISQPGDGKSPTLKMAAAPLRKWERDEQERLSATVAAKQAEFDALHEELSHLKKKLASSMDEAKKGKFRERMQEVSQSLAGQQRPELPRSIADDFTPAALGILMAGNAGRICVLSDEGNELFQILGGKHSANGGTEATLFKKAWSGECINTDRVGRDYVHLNSPLLNVVVMMQPDALRSMKNRRELAGLGVLDRLLFAFPESRMTPADAPAVPTSSQDRYDEGVLQMLSIPLNVNQETGAEPVPAVLHLDAEAHQARVEFNYRVNAMTEDGEPLAALPGWASKLKANLIRTAGILHLADHLGPQGLEVPISGDTMRRAADIAHYWIAHARKAFDLMEADRQTLGTRKAWRWVKRMAAPLKRGAAITFRKQDLWQGVRGNRGPINVMADLDAALKILADFNYIRLIKERPEIYEVNPRALD